LLTSTAVQCCTPNSHATSHVQSVYPLGLPMPHTGPFPPKGKHPQPIVESTLPAKQPKTVCTCAVHTSVHIHNARVVRNNLHGQLGNVPFTFTIVMPIRQWRMVAAVAVVSNAVATFMFATNGDGWLISLTYVMSIKHVRCHHRSVRARPDEHHSRPESDAMLLQDFNVY
jgi:hypothetical protein